MRETTQNQIILVQAPQDSTTQSRDLLYQLKCIFAAVAVIAILVGYALVFTSVVFAYMNINYESINRLCIAFIVISILSSATALFIHECESHRGE